MNPYKLKAAALNASFIGLAAAGLTPHPAEPTVNLMPPTQEITPVHERTVNPMPPQAEAPETDSYVPEISVNPAPPLDK
ncbi:MAG: hypothetical protein VXW65_09690 [Pseudomonadota bacterium]|nr:hypothetical protein [Pseudomonadota bacterium]